METVNRGLAQLPYFADPVGDFWKAHSRFLDSYRKLPDFKPAFALLRLENGGGGNLRVFVERHPGATPKQKKLATTMADAIAATASRDFPERTDARLALAQVLLEILEVTPNKNAVGASLLNRIIAEKVRKYASTREPEYLVFATKIMILLGRDAFVAIEYFMGYLDRVNSGLPPFDPRDGPIDRYDVADFLKNQKNRKLVKTGVVKLT